MFVNKGQYITPAEQRKQSSYVLPIVIVCSVLLIGAFAYMFLLRPLSILDSTSRASEIGLVEGSYKEVRKNCPTNVELAWACSRSFYVQGGANGVEATALTALKSKGYKIKLLDDGYDGPDQKALVAYSPKEDVTLVMVATNTSSEAYKSSQGNVRVEVYLGKAKYDTYDLTPELKP